MKISCARVMFFSLLLASLSACSPGGGHTGDDGAHGYVTPPTGAERKIARDSARKSGPMTLDTAGKSGPVRPSRPDSTNVMPPR